MHGQESREKIDTPGWLQVTKAALPAALIATTTLIVGNQVKKACSNAGDISPQTVPVIVNPPSVPPTVWDYDCEYDRIVPGGEFSRNEYAHRTKVTKDGTTFFRDIGSLTFYRVQDGDDFEIIRNRLLGYRDFAYLRNASEFKLKSFNLPKKSLKPGMWIPIPLPEENRIMTDRQFLNYCNQAINIMLEDRRYGMQIRDIIAKAGRRDLLASMMAVAKQESGGAPIGQFEFHRYEPSQSAFSFSLFHVLMKDTGLAARRNLNMTEGQLYHPRNAAKLFLAFLCEKTALIDRGAGGNGEPGANRAMDNGPDRYFPLMEHLEEFAVLYNGRNWKKTNPAYCDNITGYHNAALALLNAQNI